MTSIIEQPSFHENNNESLVQSFTEEMSKLYSQIRKSHFLYSMGIDEDGKKIKQDDSCWSKAKNCYAKCLEKSMDQTMKRESNASMPLTKNFSGNLQKRNLTQIARNNKFSREYSKIANTKLIWRTHSAHFEKD